MPISELGAGDAVAINGTHPSLWVGGSEILLCDRPENGGQGGISLFEMVQRVGKGDQSPTQAEHLVWFF